VLVTRRSLWLPSGFVLGVIVAGYRWKAGRASDEETEPRGLAFNPAISSDGRLIACASDRAGAISMYLTVLGTVSLLIMGRPRHAEARAHQRRKPLDLIRSRYERASMLLISNSDFSPPTQQLRCVALPRPSRHRRVLRGW
jgi:hypothetical protein